jgi:methyl halide transferase
LDLRSFKLHFVDAHVRAVVVDASGERGRDLEGEAAARVFAAAAPLIEALTAGSGARDVRAVSVDLIKRVARLSVEPQAAGEGATACTIAARVHGDAFDALAPALVQVARAIVSELRPRPELPEAPLDGAFWSEVYRRGHDGWELGRAAPPLVRWFREHPPAVGTRAFVPGCGRGHEARLLARAGCQVVAVDIVPEAIAAARELAEREGLAGAIDFRVADLFAPSGERHDLVLEHCCYCAIDPARRGEYADVLRDALVPGGVLVGLFWAHGRPGGPPFTTDRADLMARFGTRLAIRSVEEPVRDSVATRAGHELLITAEARPAPGG